MNSTTNIITNADGTISIITATRMDYGFHLPVLALALLALILIASGLFLLLRKE